VGIVAHVGCSSKSRETAGGYSRGIRVAIHLQSGSDESVDRVLAGKLAQNAVGAQAAIATGEENVGAPANIFVHADFASEGVDGLYPSALDSGDQRRVRIERPVFADFLRRPNDSA
jgi:hypothetical protein